jgi:hypothetical protein
VDAVCLVSVAPTVMTKGSLPGERTLPEPKSPSLPAAHTTAMPLCHAASTALATGSLLTGPTGLPPIEMFMTRML